VSIVTSSVVCQINVVLTVSALVDNGTRMVWLLMAWPMITQLPHVIHPCWASATRGGDAATSWPVDASD